MDSALSLPALLFRRHSVCTVLLQLVFPELGTASTIGLQRSLIVILTCNRQPASRLYSKQQRADDREQGTKRLAPEADSLKRLTGNRDDWVDV